MASATIATLAQGEAVQAAWGVEHQVADANGRIAATSPTQPATAGAALGAVSATPASTAGDQDHPVSPADRRARNAAILVASVLLPQPPFRLTSATVGIVSRLCLKLLIAMVL